MTISVADLLNDALLSGSGTATLVAVLFQDGTFIGNPFVSWQEILQGVGRQKMMSLGRF